MQTHDISNSDQVKDSTLNISVHTENTYPFTIVPNHIINNKELLCETRMTWIYLYSKVNCKNWVVRPSDIQKVLGIKDYTWRKVTAQMKQFNFFEYKVTKKGPVLSFNPKPANVVDLPTVENNAGVDLSTESNPQTPPLNSPVAKTPPVNSTPLERKDSTNKRSLKKTKSDVVNLDEEKLINGGLTELFVEGIIEASRLTCLKSEIKHHIEHRPATMERLHALNAALKLIREGKWSTPRKLGIEQITRIENTWEAEKQAEKADCIRASKKLSIPNLRPNM